MEKKYDIFISYRRDGGYETAKHLYDLLTRDGYVVSFDIDTLRNGDFDTELFKRIDLCKDFILIVDKNAFTRTLDPNFPREKDWLRCELSYALSKNKNIIPVFLSGVMGFPEDLPQDVVGVIKKNGPQYNRYYFDDFYHKLKKTFLISRKNGKHRFLLGITATLIVLSFVYYVGVIRSKTERNIVQGFQDEQAEPTLCTDYSQLKIGDYVYEDGSFSHGLYKQKVACGVVFSLKTTSSEIKNGWTHGLIMSLNDCNDGVAVAWNKKEELENNPIWDYDNEDISLGLTDKQGYSYTYDGRTSSSDFMAFKSVRNHKPKIMNASGWYLPTLGQWVDIIENLGGTKMQMTPEGKKTFQFDKESALENLMQYGIKDVYYWTATPRNMYCIWVVYLGSGNTDGYTSPIHKCYVRAICAF